VRGALAGAAAAALLAVLAACGGGPDRAGADRAAAGRTGRLVVIGLDGADWGVLDPLLAQGRLPNLKRLIDRGTRARLLSLSPMLSPVVWTTVATGVEPTRHGVLDFVVRAPDGSVQPVSSGQRRVPTVWELLSRGGVTVGVVGYWATWPAEPVRGYLVADRLAPQLFAAGAPGATGKTWPPELYADVSGWVVDPQSIGAERVAAYVGGPPGWIERAAGDERRMADDLRTVLASGDTHLRVALELRARYDPALEVVYFEGTDTLAHLFMRYRPPALPGVAPEDVQRFGQAVDRYYETADGFIGRLLAGREDAVDVMVLSDHGFASDDTRPQSTDSRIGHGAAADWHRRFGVLILSGPRMARGQVLAEASVYDIAPTVLALFDRPIPRSWPGRVLTEAFAPEVVAAHPPRRADADPARAAARSAGVDPQAEALLSKLRGLGYLSGGGAPEAVSVAEHNNAALSLMSRGRFAEAEAELRQALEDGGRRPTVVLNLALVERQQGRTEEARRLFEEALAHPVTRRIAGVQLADMALAASDLDSAERLAQGVLSHEPRAAEAHDLIGRILEARGEIAGAERAFALAADLDPESALAPTNLGNLYQRRRDPERAESWYRRAIEADPYSTGAYNNLALVYQARGKIDAAIELYQRALNKSPDHAVVINNLAALHYGQGDVDKARELWERAARADPGYASPRNNLGGLALAAGRLADAERWLAGALAIDPDYGDARANLALVWLARGDTERARRELHHAVQDPEAGAVAWIELGRLDLRAGRVEAAVMALQSAVRRAPRDVEALNALGEAQRLAGRPEQAREAWQRSLALDPRQPALRRALESGSGAHVKQQVRPE